MKNQSGYALFLTVSMVVVISFFLLAVIQVYRVRYGGIISQGNRIKAKYLAEAGIEKAKQLLVNGTDTLYQEDMDDKSGFSLSIKVRGGYFEVQSIGRFIKTRDTLKAALGQTMPISLSTAFTLNDYQKDLVVAGKTSITGDVSLVKAKIFPARVSGYTYAGDKTQTGNLIQLDHPDTLFDKPLQKQISEWRKTFTTMEGYDEVIHASLFLDSKRGFERTRFQKKRIFVEGLFEVSDSIHFDGPSEIVAEQGVTIEGQSSVNSVDIFSNGRVTIKDNAMLDNVLIYARKGIYFTDKVSVSGQFITEDTISISGNSSISYPAFCYVLPSIEDKRLKGGIFFKTTKSCSGAFIIGFRDTTNTGVMLSQRQVFLSVNGNIRGVIFNQYLTQFSGILEGHLTTQGLFLSQGSTTYLNWLLNTTIDRKKLPNTMVVPAIFSRNPVPSVMGYME